MEYISVSDTVLKRLLSSQARRTKTSSPLGELFDHGCDSLSTVFVSIASSCAVRLGLYPGWMLFQVQFKLQTLAGHFTILQTGQLL